MNSIRIAGIIVLVLGVLALAYGGFTYTKETHQTNFVPLSLSVDDKERVNVPFRADISAVLVAGILFFGIGRR